MVTWLPWLLWLDTSPVECTVALPAPHALLFPPHLPTLGSKLPTSRALSRESLSRLIQLRGKSRRVLGEICERPQQHCELVRQHCICRQSIVDERVPSNGAWQVMAVHGQPSDPVDTAFPRLLSAFATFDSEGGQTVEHTGQVSATAKPPCT